MQLLARPGRSDLHNLLKMEYQKVKLSFISTDAAANYLKAGKRIKNRNKKLTLITCFAHSRNNAVEEIENILLKQKYT